MDEGQQRKSVLLFDERSSRDASSEAPVLPAVQRLRRAHHGALSVAIPHRHSS
jgi:hypothetical protein